MKEEHILVSADGPDCNVIKLKPPMVFSKQNVDEFTTTLDRILKELRENADILTVPTYSSKTEIHPSKEPRPHKSIKEDRIKSI